MWNSCEVKGMTETGAGGGRQGGTTKLGLGSLVEVRLNEQGLRGSWHPAVVVKVESGRRVVEYEELLSEEREGEKLRETIAVGKSLDGRGVRVSPRKLSGSSSVVEHRIVLRPRPPKLSYPPSCSWTKGLWVDVFWNDSWWEGILQDSITSGKQVVNVFFPGEGGVEAYDIKYLRVRQEWDEETGVWSLKGHTGGHNSIIPSLKEYSAKKIDVGHENSGEPKCESENLQLVKQVVVKRGGAPCNDDGRVSCVWKRSQQRKQCPRSRGAINALTAQSLGSDLLKANWGNGKLKISVVRQSESSKKRVLSFHKKTIMQKKDGREIIQPPCLDETSSYRKGVVVSLQRGASSPRDCCKVARQQGGQESHGDYLGYAHDFGGGRQRQLVKQHQKAVDMKDDDSMSGMMTPAGSPDQEAAAADGCVDMLIDEKDSPHVHTPRKANHLEFAQWESSGKKPRLGMAFNIQQRHSSGETDAGQHAIIDSNHHVVKIEKSEKKCKKRPGGNHLGGDADRKRKKSRGSCPDDATLVPSGIMVPYSSQEGYKSKRAVTHYKPSAAAQDKSGKKKGTRGGCRMEVLLSGPGDNDALKEGNGGVSSNTRKNILSWLIEAGVLVKDQKVSYMHKGRKELGHGWVTSEGVICGCCNDVFTLSYFEVHCGSKLHRPCQNIFVDDGKSLTDLQMEVFEKGNALGGADSVHPLTGLGKRRRSENEEGKVEDGSDDTCGVCGDGGTLICCDHCPSTFHLACMELQEVPKDDWFCPNCRCAICGGSEFNGDQSTFNELTVLFCDQCEREFHVKCLYDRGFPKMDKCPEGSWFCGKSCTKIHQGLRGLVGITNALDDGFSWTLLRSQAEDTDLKSDFDKELMAEHNIKLSIALSVMQECFRPMIDPRTDLDLVAHALYNRGSDVSRLNYRGFYTMILEKGDELVSVATIRVHGAVVAEMPLVGTRYQYRRQGMCRRLMFAIEQMLQMVGVEALVLPAVPELMDTWIGAFDFQALDVMQKRALTQLNLMAFPGTSLLCKPLSRWQHQSHCKGLSQSVRDKVHSHLSQNRHAENGMVNVPIGGAQGLTSEDVTKSQRGDSLQTNVAKMKDAKRRNILGSESPASSPPPREVVSRRELTQSQYQGDRYRENGSTPKQHVENMYSTKVVVGTTRSKRLVKTTRWVADAMKKLIGRSYSAEGDPSSPSGLSDDRQLMAGGASKETVANIVHGSGTSSGYVRVSEDRQLIVQDTPQAQNCEDPNMATGRPTTFPQSAVSCSMEAPNPAEPQKLIIRIKLGQKKEKKEKRKKAKRHKGSKKEDATAVLGMIEEAAHLQLPFLSVRPQNCSDTTSPGLSSAESPPTMGNDALTVFQAPSPLTTLQPVNFTPAPLDIIATDNCDVVMVVPGEDFEHLANSAAMVDSSNTKRFEAPRADLVEIVPALDTQGYLLPLLNHRRHLLRCINQVPQTKYPCLT